MDTVLIVEDDKAMCLLIEFVLSQDSYKVMKAENGKEAISIVESANNEIAAILLDWQMPIMDGMEFLRWIKKEPAYCDIPVIMETSMISPENIKEGIDAGAFYYLTKPVEESVLRSIVRAAISDLKQKKVLIERAQKSENPFGKMMEGTFRFRTTEEAEVLAVAIANSSTAPQKAMVISEILLNAVEHGNLGITYEEKTALITNNMLRQEVERRLAMPEYSNKYVQLKIRRYDNGITVEIEDQGSGFDFGRFLHMDESRVFDNHGRGIALSGEYLGLNYLGNGNKVVVTIPGE